MWREMVLALAGVGASAAAIGAGPSLLQPFAAAGAEPATPWHVVGLPQQTKPFTQFSVVDLDGKRALKVEAIESYGNLVHLLQYTGATAHLAWQWRVERLIETADLRVRRGDDTTLKVCVFFDSPMDKVPFTERQALRFARSKSEDPVPTATICYVWDAKLPAGTAIDNAFTRRVRYIVVRSGSDRLNQWVSEHRDVAADFVKLFVDELDHMPAITGIAVGADSDNTHTHSIGYVTGIALEP
ncbi:MAG: DUF3047 domain-containing protein [Caldimonas sp.]